MLGKSEDEATIVANPTAEELNKHLDEIQTEIDDFKKSRQYGEGYFIGVCCIELFCQRGRRSKDKKELFILLVNRLQSLANVPFVHVLFAYYQDCSVSDMSRLTSQDHLGASRITYAEFRDIPQMTFKNRTQNLFPRDWIVPPRVIIKLAEQ